VAVAVQPGDTTAFKVAEREANAQGMCQAIRLMAELAQISLRCPEDRAQPSQHLHLHGKSLVDRPPEESMQQWLERKRLEAEQRTNKRLGVVDNDDPPAG
jgi:hypothetical protein